jgi:hypothetical protein
MQHVVANTALLLLISSTVWAAPDWGTPVGSAVTQQVGARIAPIMPNPNPAWEQVPGCARTIAAAGVNQVMVVGCGGQNASDTIYEWQASGGSGQFVAEPQGSVMLTYKRDGVVFRENLRVASQASRLAMDGVAGKVYGIGGDATLYVRDLSSPAPYRWTQFIGTQTHERPMQVTAVAAGGGTRQGGLWAIGAQPAGNGGNTIHMTYACPQQDQQASGKCWRTAQGAAQKVALGGGDVWVVSADGGIFKRAGNNWQPVEGCARDITANDSHVYVVGCDSGKDGASKIYRRVGESWLSINQTGKTLAVDVAGNLWIVKANGEIWRKKPIQPDPIR